MSETASNFIGNIPQNYDKFLGPRIFAAYAKDLAARSREVNPERVLELAAGTGIVSRELRDTLSADCHLTITDLNQPMLEVAKGKFTEKEKVSFDTLDATNLSLERDFFDLVVCQFGIMFFPDKEQSLREASRVLKNNGVYLFSVWGTWEQNPFAKIAHNTVSKFFPNNPPGFYKVPFGYNNVPALEEAVLNNGFRSVSITEVKFTSAIPSATDFATGLVFGNPLFEEITERAGDPHAVCAAIAADIEEHLGAAMPIQALIIKAVK